MPTTKNPILGERALRALALAFEVHQHQTRKGRGGETPYWNHVSTVAGMVLELRGTEDEYISALLHDSVEDRARELAAIGRAWAQDGLRAEAEGSARADSGGGAVLAAASDEDACFIYLAAAFGQAVADNVMALTDPKLPEGIRRLPQPEKAPFIRKSREAKITALRNKSESIRKIKGCDALHNARSLLSDYLDGAGPDVWRSFAGGPEGTLWYYESLADVFYDHGPARIAVELRWVCRRIRAAMKADEGV